MNARPRHRRRQPHDDGRSRLRAADAAGGGATQAGFLFPLSLAAEGSCTIGGNLATNAGGTQVLRYGNARELCLGLEVVTAQGEIWDGLSGLRKDNTGYDLRDLFIGSEGTLGIITAATMKLYPLPAAQLTAWAAVPSLDACGARCWAWRTQHLGAGPHRLRGDGPVRAGPGGASTSRSCACRCTSRRPGLRAAGELRHRIRRRMRARASRRCSKPRSRHGCVSDAVVAENLDAGARSCGTCARAFRWRRPRKA